MGFCIHILAVGRLRRGPFTELAAVYRDRIRVPLETLEIEARKGISDAARTAEEGRLLLQALPPGALVAALDERGKSLNSMDFATLVATSRDAARPLVFLLGGADGHSAEVRARADLMIAFGQATWPHQLARVMLLEQIYRAETILAGHPYHREG